MLPIFSLGEWKKRLPWKTRPRKMRTEGLSLPHRLRPCHRNEVNLSVTPSPWHHGFGQFNTKWNCSYASSFMPTRKCHHGLVSHNVFITEWEDFVSHHWRRHTIGELKSDHWRIWVTPWTVWIYTIDQSNDVNHESHISCRLSPIRVILTGKLLIWLSPTSLLTPPPTMGVSFVDIHRHKRGISY